jgi:chaperone modulatory protein CbpM
VSERLILFAEFESACGLTRAEIVELVEYGVFTPTGTGPQEWTFPDSAIARAREAVQLRREFELELHGIAILLAYRERIEELEDRVRQLECLLPR